MAQQIQTLKRWKFQEKQKCESSENSELGFEVNSRYCSPAISNQFDALLSVVTKEVFGCH